MTSNTAVRPVPAASPMKIAVHSYDGGGDTYVETNYRLNEAGTDYRLYANNGFQGIPPEGDPYGVVAAVVRQANRPDSGVTTIGVGTHKLSLGFSGAMSIEERDALCLDAFRPAGIPHVVVDHPRSRKA